MTDAKKIPSLLTAGNKNLLDFRDTMKFGKYKSCTIEHIIEQEASYIDWLEDHTDVRFTQEVRRAADSAAQDQLDEYHAQERDW